MLICKTKIKKIMRIKQSNFQVEKTLESFKSEDLRTYRGDFLL